MPQWNSALTSALRFTDATPSGGTNPTSGEVQAMWLADHYMLRARLATVGLSATVGSNTPARTLMAQVEAYCLCADYEETYASRTGKAVSKHSVSLRGHCSSWMTKLTDDPHILASLSGATLIAARVPSISGSFTDAVSTLSNVGMEDDVNFTRESTW